MEYKTVKKLLFIVILIIFMFFVLPIILFLVPVKFAVDMNKVEPTNDYECYIIEPTENTYGYWAVCTDVNGNSTNPMCFNELTGKNFEIILGEDFIGNRDNYRVPNKFVIYGHKYFYNEEDKIYGFEIDDWDIVAPIYRDNLYGLIASTNYLTIYDYINR